MNQKKWLAYDIETKEFFPKGTRDFSHMSISMCGWYTSWDKQVKTVTDEDIHEFFSDIRECHLCVGFNTKRFDNIILEQYDSDDILQKRPHFDMWEETYETLGHMVSLDSIARASLNRKKSGHGSKAPILWKEGRYEELRSYLIQDVILTKDVFIKACKEGSLTFESKIPPNETLPIDCSHWFEKAQDLMKVNDIESNEDKLKKDLRTVFLNHAYSEEKTDSLIALIEFFLEDKEVEDGSKRKI